MCLTSLKYKLFIILGFIFLDFNINFVKINSNTDREYVSEMILEYNESQIFQWYPKPLGEPNPSDWPGENGEAYNVNEDKNIYEEYFKIHEFNILATDRIALNRTLKDERLTNCKDKVYRDRLPNTSVIIVFHNEAFSTLLRTVHSVIKTSSNLLLEIILVDDCSNRVYLRRQLEDYVKQLSVPIKIIRMGKRSGLIRARLLGSAHAKGQVLTFLDAHCECNEGWLEPLLDRIAGDRSRVVSPLIDVIDDHTFKYVTAGDMIFGGFNWKIGFRWYSAPKRELQRRNFDRSLPLRTPTLSGGLFAIDRDFFKYIGEYDPGMIIWGAENLEFSFRVWMCGGSIEIVTCSRVGHVFRSKTPYTLPGGSDYIVWHNTARMVDVWLDEWKDFYFATHPGARAIDRGNIEQRVLLRKQRNCKSFQWYLDNIFPESNLPQNYHYLGDIRNIGLKYLCLDSMFKENNGKIVLNECSLEKSHHLVYNQLFLFSNQNQILNDEKCLDVMAINETVVLKRCRIDTQNRDQQKWEYNKENQTLMHWLTKGCLDVTEQQTDNPLVLLECDYNKLTQKWLLQDNFEWQSSKHTIK